jgi:hypothetical protein
MLKTILFVFAVSISYAFTIIMDAVLTPVYLVKAIKNTEKNGIE